MQTSLARAVAVSNVELRVTATGAVKELKRTDKEAKKLNATFEQTKRKTATATANIQRFGIAFRSVIGPVVALTGAVTFLNRSLTVFADRQADANLLAAGLKKIGAASGDLEKLQKVASNLGEQTLFNQEDFTQGFALLTSFRAIGQDSFERVATAAADMAATTKQDVNSSLLQLAKALENPVEGMSALSRSGTTFTKVQKDIVKGLVESNRTLEAQSYILDLVEEQYKGNARAAAVGLAGAQDTLSEAIRDFNEVVGQISLGPVIAATNALTELFKQATGDLTEWNKAFNVLSQLLAPITGGIDLVGQSFKNTAEIIKLGIPGLSATLQMYEKFIQLRSGLAAMGDLPGTSEDLRPEQGAALDPAAIARFRRQLQLEDLFKQAPKTTSAVAGKERVDISQKLYDLNKQLLDSDTQLTELQKIGLEFQIQRQEILERNLLPREQEIALLQAQAGFEADLLGYREDQLKIQQNAADLAEREQKRREEEERRRLEADPGFQMKQQLEEMLKLENQVAAGATAIGNAFANSFKAVITGSKSAEEALADMLSSVAEHFINMAAKIIAQQITMILYGTIMKALGVSMPGGGGGSTTPPVTMPDAPQLTAANGGPVFGNSPVIVGERGPELFVPFGNGEITSSESLGADMANAMSIPFVPGGNQGGTTSQMLSRQENIQVNRQENLRQLSVPFTRTSEASMMAAAEKQTAEAISNPGPLDVRFESQSINGVEYVTAEQHQAGMAQAAERGRALTLQALQNSVKSRRKIGL